MTVTGLVRRRSRPATAFLVSVAAATLMAACGLQGRPGSGDPNVRGNIGLDFMWAVGEPTRVIGPIDPDAARASVDRAAATIEAERDVDFPISIVAAFDTREQALTHADQIREVLEASATWYDDPRNAAARGARDDPEQRAPLTPPEEAALRRLALAAGDRGVGWGGQPDHATDAVYTLGPLLVVTGLESDAFATDGEPPLHPLAHLLAAVGADVRFEGDNWGEGSIVADVSCRIRDPATGPALLEEAGDAVVTSQYNVRPPWLGPPITADQALARATVRRWVAGFSAGPSDPRILEYARRYADAPTSEARSAALAALEQYLLQRGLENVEGELDPTTFALIADQPDTDDRQARDAWERQIRERIGGLRMEPSKFGDRPNPDDYAQVPFTGMLRLNGGRLELGWLTFGRFSAALPYLAAYLDERGCDELKVGTVDFDIVRGD